MYPFKIIINYILNCAWQKNITNKERCAKVIVLSKRVTSSRKPLGIRQGIVNALGEEYRDNVLQCHLCEW